ncbi:MAG TPA: formaldehyde dehydrogenase, glutathione-independent [Pseudomonas sp.]|nr:formaldehyde dehydrogenase, glutathione-independent [Pseudomonas sp.]
MATMRAAVFVEPGRIELADKPIPEVGPTDALIRITTTTICGTDVHILKGEYPIARGLTVGHEPVGVIEKLGSAVKGYQEGQRVIAGAICPNFNSYAAQDGVASQDGSYLQASGRCECHGYKATAGWRFGNLIDGTQAEYVLVPYADFNLLKLPDRDKAMEKIRDLTCLSDILPTGYHGAVTAGVGPGSTVYVAGAGPVGLAAAASARLLGAACVIVGDLNPARLAHAKAQGFEVVDLSKDTPLHEQIIDILGEPEVDCAVDAVGFEARGHGHEGAKHEAPATVLNSLMQVTRVAGKIGIPGLYVTEDPGAVDAAAKVGALSIRFGLGWAKSHSFHTGQTPVMKYNRALMQAIMWDRINIAEVVGVQVISLDQAPEGYGEFDAGVPKKFVIDPHKMFSAA